MSDVNTDTGVILEALNDKADRDMNNVADGIDFVVESYNNGTEWYKLYKSGWVEQGGLKLGTGAASYNTVTLLKQMADNNYTITAMCKFKYAWCCEATDVQKTTTQFSIYTVDNGGNGYSRDFYWEVKGMSA